ncbi:MAG: sulfurtransferase [Sarcina sp.]
MNSKFQKAAVAVIAIVVFLATFFGSTREQVVVEARKIVSDSNNINNNYLIGAQSLESILTQKNLVILDIRSSQEYDKGHIPGAINVSWSNFVDSTKATSNSNNENNQNNTNANENSNANNNNTNGSNTNTNTNNANNNNNNTNNSNVNSNSTTASSEQNNQGLNNITPDNPNWTSFVDKTKLTKQLQDLGINQNSEVVIYGDSNGDDLGALGKFSWMFRMIGINSKMLNGGYKNWVAQGFQITTQVPTVTKSNIQIENFVPVKTFSESDLAKNINKIKIVELINDVKENDNENVISPNSDGANNTSNGVESSNLNLDTQAEDNKIDPPINGVIRIKLSDLLNPNGTIKPVNQLDNIFESNGINKDDIILFYNTDNGNLAFLSLIMNMAGYENIAHFNANLAQVTTITNELLKEKEQSNKNNNANNSNSQNNNSGSNNSNSGNSGNQNTQSNNSGSNSTSGTSQNSVSTSNNANSSNGNTTQNSNNN